jgi:hypothetical protein
MGWTDEDENDGENSLPRDLSNVIMSRLQGVYGLGYRPSTDTANVFKSKSKAVKTKKGSHISMKNLLRFVLT